MTRNLLIRSFCYASHGKIELNHFILDGFQPNRGKKALLLVLLIGTTLGHWVLWIRGRLLQRLNILTLQH